METIKKYVGIFGAAVIAILGALLYRKDKQLDTAESQVASEKTTTEITLNDEARKAAKQTADDLLTAYEKMKNGEN